MLTRKTCLIVIIALIQPQRCKSNETVWVLFFDLIAISLLIHTCSMHFYKNPRFRPWPAVVNFVQPSVSSSYQIKITLIEFFSRCRFFLSKITSNVQIRLIKQI